MPVVQANPGGSGPSRHLAFQHLGREELSIAMQHVMAVRANGPQVSFRNDLPFALRERVQVMDVDEAFAMRPVAILEVETADHARQAIPSNTPGPSVGASLGAHGYRRNPSSLEVCYIWICMLEVQFVKVPVRSVALDVVSGCSAPVLAIL